MAIAKDGDLSQRVRRCHKRDVARRRWLMFQQEGAKQVAREHESISLQGDLESASLHQLVP